MESFPFAIRLHRHAALMHPIAKRFPCSYVGCDKSFSRKADKQHHEDEAHVVRLKETVVGCPRMGCYYIFPTVKALEQHLILETAISHRRKRSFQIFPFDDLIPAPTTNAENTEVE
jgi:hypothetical protein